MCMVLMGDTHYTHGRCLLFSWWVPKAVFMVLMSGTYSTHERVEHGHGEGCAARERLRHVELRIRIVVVVLIQKLHVCVISCNQTSHITLTTSKTLLYFGHI